MTLTRVRIFVLCQMVTIFGPRLLMRLNTIGSNCVQGLAIAVDETMYIADGRNVRVVTPDGNINTLIGNQGHQG